MAPNAALQKNDYWFTSPQFTYINPSVTIDFLKESQHQHPFYKSFPAQPSKDSLFLFIDCSWYFGKQAMKNILNQYVIFKQDLSRSHHKTCMYKIDLMMLQHSLEKSTLLVYMTTFNFFFVAPESVQGYHIFQMISRKLHDNDCMKSAHLSCAF